MIRKKNNSAVIGAAALALGIGILLTFLLSPRALVFVQASALIVAGGAYFFCRK